MSNKKTEKFDEIDKMFENLQKANDETVDSFKQRLNENKSSQVNLSDLNTRMRKTMMVKRPVVPDRVDIEFNTRYDYFLYLIQNVNYGSSNSENYVIGHRRALSKYLNEANRNPADLSLCEAAISDEIHSMLNRSKTSLDTKGYFDGLNYVHKSLRKSKEIMAERINNILKRELN